MRVVKQDLAKQALEMRCEGMPYHKIGEVLGINHQTAWNWVNKELDKLREETRDTADKLRTIEHQRLEALYAKCMEGLASSWADGKHAYAIKWVEQARKTSESIRKLYGMDAPEKVEVGVVEGGLTEQEILHELDKWMEANVN